MLLSQSLAQQVQDGSCSVQARCRSRYKHDVLQKRLGSRGQGQPQTQGHGLRHHTSMQKSQEKTLALSPGGKIHTQKDALLGLKKYQGSLPRD